MDETTTTVYSGSASGLVSQMSKMWPLAVLWWQHMGWVHVQCHLYTPPGPVSIVPVTLDCIGGLVASGAGCCCSNEPGRARAQPRPQARQEYNQGRRRGSRVVPVTRGDPGWPGHPHAGWQSTRSPQVLKIGRMLWNIVIWFSQSNIFMVPPLLNIHYQTTFILLGFEETSTI